MRRMDPTQQLVPSGLHQPRAPYLGPLCSSRRRWTIPSSSCRAGFTSRPRTMGPICISRLRDPVNQFNTRGTLCSHFSSSIWPSTNRSTRSPSPPGQPQRPGCARRHLLGNRGQRGTPDRGLPRRRGHDPVPRPRGGGLGLWVVDASGRRVASGTVRPANAPGARRGPRGQPDPTTTARETFMYLHLVPHLRNLYKRECLVISDSSLNHTFRLSKNRVV